MIKLGLVYTPHKVLNQKAQPITKFDSKVKQIAKEMERVVKSCTDPEGVGLAAPQVGLSLQLFLIKPEKDSAIRFFANPQIIKKSKKVNSDTKSLEGCLSIKNIWSHVTRHDWVVLKYQDLTGKIHEERFTGFIARIIQHEVDHLNGVLFTHHSLEQGEEFYRIEKNEKGKEKLVPIEI
jgi:peptide deformylase